MQEVSANTEVLKARSDGAFCASRGNVFHEAAAL